MNTDFTNNPVFNRILQEAVDGKDKLGQAIITDYAKDRGIKVENAPKFFKKEIKRKGGEKK